MYVTTNGEEMVSDCHRCHEEIKDRSYTLAGKRMWHNECMKCHQCDFSLASEFACYERKGQHYCKNCYLSILSATKCGSCDSSISKQDLVMQARARYYHMPCFRCSVCSCLLKKGQKFGIRRHKLVCEEHFYDCNKSASPGSELEETSASRDASGLSSSACAIDVHSESGMGVACVGAISQDISGPVSSFGAGIASGSRANHTFLKESFESLHLFRAASKPPSTGFESGKSIHGSDSPDRTLESPDNRSCSSSAHSGDGENSMHGSSCNASDAQLDNSHREYNRQGKLKRVRTSFKFEQLKSMKDLFERDRNPDSYTLNDLSKKIRLSKRVLQVWFQNARAKYRKEHGLAPPRGNASSSSFEESEQNEENSTLDEPAKQQKAPADGAFFADDD